MGGYILANTVGDIIAYSEAYLPNSVHINNNDLFNQISAEPYSFKWLNDQLVTTPRPSQYHKWTGTEWVVDAQYLNEFRLDVWWCSELVAYLLKCIGLILNGWGRKVNTYTPPMWLIGQFFEVFSKASLFSLHQSDDV